MALHELRVAGYRSIKDLSLKLTNLNVLTGPNGSGKSNLYNAMYLLAGAASGELARTLAQEGGMPSALWAGPRGKGPVRMALYARTDAFSYELQCGLPPPDQKSVFKTDPEVKEERVCHDEGGGARRVTMLDRKAKTASVRGADGRMQAFPLELSVSETALAQLRDPLRYPELALLREEMGAWRFYHHFRTDATSPLRQPCVKVRTPLLHHSGQDLGPALQTILETGPAGKLDEFLSAAFPGARLELECRDSIRITLRMPGLERALDARELSDGTLRFLCLLAALLSPRPPALIALNEPETSLHPDLLDPLGKLIAFAAQRSQLWVVTHAQPLAEAIQRHAGQPPIRLALEDGETRVVGRTVFGDPA